VITTRTEVERSTEGFERRPVSWALSLSVASGEVDGILGAGSAGTATADEKVPASQHHDPGRFRVDGFDRAEQRMPHRHLVIFPARVV
jgi:ABC-type lipopolysaccharide export system ATPase subunit